MNIEALRFFIKLYELRNLSEAADATGISPSAASRMLGKLREMFGDELFHRYAHGMTPTVRSHALYEPTLQLLSAYGKLFETSTFDRTLPIHVLLQFGFSTRSKKGHQPQGGAL